jgi:hypothetical protein
MKPFKYTTSFASSIIACTQLESEEWQRWNVSNASLSSLKDIMPKEVNLNKNIDLLGVAFNAAVVNQFNKNGDGIDSETAINIKDYFINKPANIEHERKKIVGHIVGSSFSSFANSELLSNDQVQDLNNPFNIALAAVVYKTVNPQFAAVLESAVENGLDKQISASWELGFNEFAIALGSKDLREAEIISDPKMIGEFEQYLKSEGGDGETKDGTKVYRLVKGEVYPLGIGFTTNPAADVEGVHVLNPEDFNETATYDLSEEKEEVPMDEKKYSENISQSNKLTVKTQKLNTMENLIKKLEEILDNKLSDQEYAKETVASIAGVITEAIREKSDQYVQEKKELDSEKQRLAKAEEDFKASVAELETKLSETQSKLETLEVEKQEREATARFNSRMAEIDEEYELDADDRKIVASEVSQLGESQEAFNGLKEKFAVMWKTKTKAFIEEAEAKVQEKINEEVQKRIESLNLVEASEDAAEEKSVEDVLENAQTEEVEVATNNSAEASKQEETLAQKFSSVFTKENVNIQY